MSEYSSTLLEGDDPANRDTVDLSEVRDALRAMDAAATVPTEDEHPPTVTINHNHFHGVVPGSESGASESPAQPLPPLEVHLRQPHRLGRKVVALAAVVGVVVGGAEVLKKIPRFPSFGHHTLPKTARAIGNALAHPIQFEENYSLTMKGAIEQFSMNSLLGSVDATVAGQADFNIQVVEKILGLPEKVGPVKTSVSDHKDTPVSLTPEVDQNQQPVSDFHILLSSGIVTDIDVVQERDATNQEDGWHLMVTIDPSKLPNPELSGYVGPKEPKEGTLMQLNDLFHSGNELAAQQNIAIMALERYLKVKAGEELAPAIEAVIAKAMQDQLRTFAQTTAALNAVNPEAFGLTPETAAKYRDALLRLASQTVVVRAVSTVDNSESAIQKHAAPSDPQTIYAPGSEIATTYRKMLEDEYSTPGSPLYFPDKATLASKNMLNTDPSHINLTYADSITVSPVAQQALDAATAVNNPYFYTGDMSTLRTPTQLNENAITRRLE